MTGRWVLRGLAQRRLPVGLSVLAFALALAFLFACIRLQASLTEGVPRGTTLEPGSFTVFQHDPQGGVSFFLSPAQIERLQNALRGTAEVIGASGVRALALGMPEGTAAAPTLQADFVSPGFFRVLGVRFAAGDASQFEATEDGIVLSDAYVDSLGGSQAPASVLVQGRRLKVVGVAAGFSGLFDRDTQAWIHWRQADGLLFPDLGGAEVIPTSRQPWFYWTLVAPAAGAAAEVGTILRSGELGSAIVERPFTQLAVVEGITNQLDLRRAASAGQDVYWQLSLLLSAVACLALALTVSMVRLARLPNELVQLQLGMPRSGLLHLLAHHSVWPALAAVAVGAGASVVVGVLLQREPSVAALMAWSADLEAGFPWWSATLSLLSAIAVTAALQLAFVRSAGLRFATRTLDPRQRTLHRFFGVFELVLVAVAATALALGSIAAVSSVAQLAQIRDSERPDTWAVTFRLDEAASLGRSAQHTFLARMGDAPARPFLAAFVSVLPLSEARRPPVTFTAGTAAVTMLENPIGPDAFGPGRLRLLAGRTFEPGAVDEVVIDEGAGNLLQTAIAPQPVLGAQVRNEFGESFTVVGIAESMTYATSAELRRPVAYTSIGTITRRGALLVFGAGTPERVRAAIDDAGRSLPGFAVDRLEALADRGQRVGARYRAKATLTAAAAAVAAVVALLLIASVTTMRARLASQERAIRMALGAAPARLTVATMRATGIRLLVGTAIGLVAAWSLSFGGAVPAPVGLLFVPIAALCVFLLVGLLMAGTLAHRIVNRTDVTRLLRAD
jgi:hypothetical protein